MTTTARDTPTRHGDQPRELNGAAGAAVLVYLGLALQLLQVGIIPMLPQIGKAIHTTPATTSWLVTASLLSGAVFLAVLSRLADLIGKKAVVQIALVLVLAGSILGLVVDSFAGLVVARVLMGAILPMLALPEAIASDTMSPQRAHTTIGAIHAGTGAGISAGLILGALAATGHADYRSFFAVGVVASLIGIVAVATSVTDSPDRASGSLDVVGAVLLSLGLVGVLLAITEGPTWGWHSGRVLGCGLGGLVALAVLWPQQRRAAHPLISLRHLTMPQIRLPYAITFLVSIGIYSALSAVTRLAQTPSITGAGYGWSATKVVLYALPQFIGALVGLVIIRTLVRRGRVLVAHAVGIALLVVCFLLYGLLIAHAAGTLTALLVDSAGLATTLATAQILVLRSVPVAESGIAVGLTIVLYAVGNAVGSAVTGALFAAHHLAGTTTPNLTAYRLSFLVAGVACAVALALVVPLWRRADARAA